MWIGLIGLVAITDQIDLPPFLFEAGAFSLPAYIAVVILTLVLKKDLILSPFKPFFYCALFILFLPTAAYRIIPAEWAWPMPDSTPTLAPDDGQPAASTSDWIGRSQIYDAYGRYLTGWFAKNGLSPFDTTTILGTGPDNGLGHGPNSIAVYFDGAEKIILYESEDRIILEQADDSVSTPPPRGRFEKKLFKSAWYKWPLASLSEPCCCLPPHSSARPRCRFNGWTRKAREGQTRMMR